MRNLQNVLHNFKIAHAQFANFWPNLNSNRYVLTLVLTLMLTQTWETYFMGPRSVIQKPLPVDVSVWGGEPQTPLQ